MDLFTEVRSHPLFQGIEEEGIRRLFSCFSFRRVHFQKDQYLVLEGDPIPYVGLVLRGTVLMEKSDFQGNNYFFTEFRKGDLFGDTFVDLNIRSSTVNYKAVTACSVLLFHYQDVRTHCLKSCRCHLIFSENLIYLLALKTRTFLAKLEILSTHSLRGRILRFLHLMEEYPDIPGHRETGEIQGKGKKNQVFVPLNRTELAEYLGVNRSALSRELRRMQEEGLLLVEQNLFTLLPSQSAAGSDSVIQDF